MSILVAFTLYIASGVQILYRNDDDDEDDDFDNFTTSRCNTTLEAILRMRMMTIQLWGYYIRGMMVTLPFWHLCSSHLHLA